VHGGGGQEQRGDALAAKGRRDGYVQRERVRRIS
jgi:hypothetical protein